MLPSRSPSCLSSLKFLRCVLQPVPTSAIRSSLTPFIDIRRFHKLRPLQALISQKLYDVGEGTKEAEIIQWYVQEGAHVQEWGKLCEVATDKSTVDITSRHAGVVKKLHHEQDAIVQVGQPLIDIEVEGEADVDPEKEEVQDGDDALEEGPEKAASDEAYQRPETQRDPFNVDLAAEGEGDAIMEAPQPKGTHASLATPAVRGMLKEHGIAVEDVRGSGRDGRVLKEDVQKFLSERKQSPTAQTGQAVTRPSPSADATQVETAQRLTPVQTQMFRTMTTSLSIPHFLYSETINITRLSALRKRLNDTRDPSSTPKLSFLPFVIKAVSLALYKYPILNARIDTSLNAQKPQLIMRSNHNIGIAMDTPSGLLVPVVKNVNALSIVAIAHELARLSALGQEGKLSNADLSGGTITVSNIGSIGGDVVAPIIVDGQLSIMGMGRVKAVPIFAEDGKSVERAEMMGVSWSADHRVVDGATMARAAKVVQGLLEDPPTMMVEMT